MNIVLLSGSQRLRSQSAKVMSVAAQKLQAMAGVNQVESIELAELQLPFWGEDLTREEQEAIAGFEQYLLNADALVFITPEWHGMVPAALKNVFLHYSGGQLAHKPALIISVSAVDGGSYPVAELRSSSYKNSRVCYLPEHLIVRHVESIFNGNDEDNDKRLQAYLNRRMDYCLSLLIAYSNGLSQVRGDIDAIISGSDFANGM